MHTILLTDAHGGVTSIQCSVPDTRDHALVRESHHYRLGLMRDLAMWFCRSELSSITWPGNLGPDRSLFGFGGESSLHHHENTVERRFWHKLCSFWIQVFPSLDTLSCWWNSLLVLEIGSCLYFRREMKQNDEYLGDFFSHRKTLWTTSNQPFPANFPCLITPKQCAYVYMDKNRFWSHLCEEWPKNLENLHSNPLHDCIESIKIACKRI